jgi:ribosomal subunit interface protein
MIVEIQTRDVAMAPEWREMIDERLARLLKRHPRLVRVHVTLRHGGHHKQGAEEVDVVATCPGTTLRAEKHADAMRDALHAALDALERELAARRGAREGARVRMRAFAGG